MDTIQVFLSLVRLGIGHDDFFIISSHNNEKSYSIDWNAIYDLANKHGLLAIILDGIELIPASLIPSQDVMLQWIGEVLNNYEARYQDYERSIAKLADFYHLHDIRMMVLKGYGLSLYYPKSDHRPCGDIDTWNFGKQKEADTILTKKTGIPVDTSEHHHTVFYWEGNMVENHYDMLITTATKTNKQLELILKELAMDDTHFVELKNTSINSATKVYLPSANFNALFLLRHMLMHFVACGINVRNILDWGFFWEKKGKEVDEKWLSGLLEKHHMTAFFNIINAICVGELGFQSTFFPNVKYIPHMKDRVLKEILEPEYDWKKAHDKNVFKRILFKYKRWKGGAWKRELCFGEGSLESFVWSVRSHLLKPASI